MPKRKTSHYRMNYSLEGQRKSHSFWTTPLNDWAYARAWLAANHPAAVLLSVEYIGPHDTTPSKSQRIQADLVREGYSRREAYREVHGE